MVGKGWRQECEVAGHIAFTGRKQSKVNEMNAGARLAFSFLFRLESQFMGWFLLHAERASSPQRNLSGNIPQTVDTPRGVFP